MYKVLPFAPKRRSVTALVWPWLEFRKHAARMADKRTKLTLVAVATGHNLICDNAQVGILANVGMPFGFAGADGPTGIRFYQRSQKGLGPF